MTLNIPNWWSVEAKRQSLGTQELSALEAFVYAFEPASSADEAVFAQALRLAIEEVVNQATATLQREVAQFKRRDVLFGDVIANHCIAMQAAVIEEVLGEGAEAAMVWISNTLCGPGLLPNLEEALRLGGAQAWFDARSAERQAQVRAVQAEAGA